MKTRETVQFTKIPAKDNATNSLAWLRELGMESSKNKQKTPITMNNGSFSLG